MGKVKKAGAARKHGNVGTIGKPRKVKAVSKRPTAKKKKPSPTPPPATFAVRELDPIRKCGAGTSVQLLYRVDETTGNLTRPHLIFFDRHGWYCDHGRDCPAVSHARRDAKRNHAHMVLAYDESHKPDRLKTAG